MTPKLFKAAEVCEKTGLQPYVLRSWEKEFPWIGLQKSPDSPRLYRQADVDQVLKIKELVFTEGLTLAGARRRIEESRPVTAQSAKAEAAEVFSVLGADARARIDHVRTGLRSILTLLSGGRDGSYELSPPPSKESRSSRKVVRAVPARRKPAIVAKRHASAKRSTKRKHA